MSTETMGFTISRMSSHTHEVNNQVHCLHFINQMILWQKESNSSDALYVDLLGIMEYPLNNTRINRKKNNDFSLRTRKEGNTKFLQNDFEGAMTMYNQSICFAEDDEFLSLAYGNRSSCFLNLQMYDNCLIDINLAKKANYPENLMPKLDDRKQKCLRMQSDAQISNEQKLSFQANNNLSCMADVLQIDKSDHYGRLIRAKTDLQIGDTVLIEEAYVYSVFGERDKCSICGKEKINFIPCVNCADAMFCNEKCASNNFHDLECDMVIGSSSYCDNESISYVLQSVLIGINTFETISEMIKFVENCRLSDTHEISQSIASPELKYRTFFKLSSVLYDRKSAEFRKQAYFIFNAIMGSSKLATKFETKQSQRFLIHLIIHHACVLQNNSFGGPSEVSLAKYGTSISREEDETDVEKHLYLMVSYFNHSCIPNVALLCKANLGVVKVILPVKRGEQLFITYIDDPASMTEEDRNLQLENLYGFRCKCELCTKGVKSRSLILQADQGFNFVVDMVKTINEKKDKIDSDLIRDIRGHCISILLKYPQEKSSKEYIFISATLVAMFQKEISA